MVKRVVCREYHSCKTVNEADGKKKTNYKKQLHLSRNLFKPTREVMESDKLGKVIVTALHSTCNSKILIKIVNFL